MKGLSETMKLEREQELPTIKFPVKNIAQVITYVNYLVNLLGQKGIIGDRAEFLKGFVSFRENQGTPQGFVDTTYYEEANESGKV